jgi:hypothetical protein
MLLLLPMNSHAWEPSTKELDAAINAGDFAGYFTNISTWLNQKVPAASSGISEESMKSLLKDPVFVNTLDQRQFISKCAVANVNAFAKADPANREFLTWLLKNTQVMDLFLEAIGPAAIAERDKNSYTIPAEILDGGGDYVLNVKLNQPTLYQGMMHYFDDRSRRDALLLCLSCAGQFARSLALAGLEGQLGN